MACNAAAQTQECKFALIAEWPLRAEQYRPVIDGEINGQKIGILLDTGAGQSSIRPSGISRLGLTRFRVEGALVPGLGVEPGAEYVYLDEFRIGSAVRKNWRGSVAGEDDFGDENFFVLGGDFFYPGDVEFDLARDVITMYESKKCE